MVNRRSLLAFIATLPLQTRFAAAAQLGQLLPHRRKGAPLPQPLVFIGTDTAKGNAQGIYLCRFDPNKGQLSTPTVAATTFRPAYLAHNEVLGRNGASRHVVYACNEGEGKTSTISTFLLNPQTGTLSQIGQVSSGANGPCYIAVDTTGHSAYVANYAGGGVSSYSVNPDGTLSEPVDRVDFHNQAVFGHHGPDKGRQDGPHPHSSMLSPDNRFLVVNDLGNDKIATFPIDPKTAHLGPPHLFESLSPGSGPRHVAFHPNQRWAYGINELASRLDQYLYTATHGGSGVAPEAIFTGTGHSVSTLDPDFHGVNTAAEVAVAPTGEFLYASNRGEDSLVVYAIDEASGTLSFRQRIACGGKTPRHFTLDRSGDWLLCGNQDSASVTVFARDPASGRLTGPVQTLAIESPMFTLFV